MSDKNLEVIEEIRQLSGLTQEQAFEFFRALRLYALGAYSAKEDIEIPFIGKIHLRFDKDIVTEEGREAQFIQFIQISDSLKRDLGQYQDALVDGDFSKISALKQQEQELENLLKLKYQV